MNLLPVDELNVLTAEIAAQEPGKRNIDELFDSVLDFLLFAYFSGAMDAAEALGIQTEPNIEKARVAINKEIAGKTYKDRIQAYANGESADGQNATEEIVRVIDTDMTRVYNTAVLDTGEANGATKKTWGTMLDDRVRDTHSPLEGVTIPLDAMFYTWDGDKALQPGGFEKAENNCNCRCLLTVS